MKDPHVIQVDDIAEGEAKAHMMMLGSAFTAGVDVLRKSRNPTIQALMSLMYDLVGHKITPVVIGPDVASLSFGVVQHSAYIFMPQAWNTLYTENPILQLGALVYIGSQCRDFYNGRISHEPWDTTRQRSLMYEAEFLLTLDGSRCSFTDYQRDVLRQFPKGVASEAAKDLIYESLPWKSPVLN